MGKTAIIIAVVGSVLMVAVTALFLVFDALGVAERQLPDGTVSSIPWQWSAVATLLVFFGIVAVSWYKLLRLVKVPLLQKARALLNSRAAELLSLSESGALTEDSVKVLLDVAAAEVTRILGQYEGQVFRRLTGNFLDPAVQVSGDRNIQALQAGASWLNSRANQMTVESIVPDFKL